MNKTTPFALLLLVSTVVGQPSTTPARPTFAEHIGPLVRQSCMDCHRPQGPAPFALVTYTDVAKRADMLKAVIETRYMPPWHPADQSDHFLSNRRLSDDQIALFTKWVETGKTRGDLSKMDKPKKYPGGWSLGKPDLVVKMRKPFRVPADGRDLYRFFVVPIDLPEDKWVKAVEMRPSARSVVHHALFFLTESSDQDEYEGDTGRRGFGGLRGFRGGAFGRGFEIRGLGGYVPGNQPQFLRDDLALELPKHHDLLMQMHFHPSGKAETEQSTIGIWFADKPPSQRIKQIQLPSLFGFMSGLDIPAGESNYKIEQSLTLPVDVDGISVGGHAHYICSTMHLTAKLPDGSTKTLLHIPEWDMDWQTEYHYKDRLPLPAGTELKCEITYDNSAQNPANPNSPPIRVRWGRQSTDEMGSVTLRVVAKNEADTDRLNDAIEQSMIESLSQRFGGFGGLGGFGRGGSSGRGGRSLDRFDKNNDGKIVPDELPSVLRKRHMRRYDKNNDGVIDAEEMKG